MPKRKRGSSSKKRFKRKRNNSLSKRSSKLSGKRSGFRSRLRKFKRRGGSKKTFAKRVKDVMSQAAGFFHYNYYSNAVLTAAIGVQAVATSAFMDQVMLSNSVGAINTRYGITVGDAERLEIAKAYKVWHFTNVANTDTAVTFYYCTPRVDTTTAAPFSDGSTPGVSWDVGNIDMSSTAGLSAYIDQDPRQSRVFNKYWVVYKKRYQIIRPGGHATVRMVRNNVSYLRSQLQTNVIALKGVSKYLLWTIHGTTALVDTTATASTTLCKIIYTARQSIAYKLTTDLIPDEPCTIVGSGHITTGTPVFSCRPATELNANSSFAA